MRASMVEEEVALTPTGHACIRDCVAPGRTGVGANGVTSIACEMRHRSRHDIQYCVDRESVNLHTVGTLLLSTVLYCTVVLFYGDCKTRVRPFL